MVRKKGLIIVLMMIICSSFVFADDPYCVVQYYDHNHRIDFIEEELSGESFKEFLSYTDYFPGLNGVLPFDLSSLSNDCKANPHTSRDDDGSFLFVSYLYVFGEEFTLNPALCAYAKDDAALFTKSDSVKSNAQFLVLKPDLELDDHSSLWNWDSLIVDNYSYMLAGVANNDKGWRCVYEDSYDTNTKVDVNGFYFDEVPPGNISLSPGIYLIVGGVSLDGTPDRGSDSEQSLVAFGFNSNYVGLIDGSDSFGAPAGSVGINLSLFNQGAFFSNKLMIPDEEINFRDVDDSKVLRDLFRDSAKRYQSVCEGVLGGDFINDGESSDCCFYPEDEDNGFLKDGEMYVCLNTRWVGKSSRDYCALRAGSNDASNVFVDDINPDDVSLIDSVLNASDGCCGDDNPFVDACFGTIKSCVEFSYSDCPTNIGCHQYSDACTGDLSVVDFCKGFDELYYVNYEVDHCTNNDFARGVCKREGNECVPVDSSESIPCLGIYVLDENLCDISSDYRIYSWDGCYYDNICHSSYQSQNTDCHQFDESKTDCEFFSDCFWRNASIVNLAFNLGDLFYFSSSSSGLNRYFCSKDWNESDGDSLTVDYSLGSWRWWDAKTDKFRIHTIRGVR